MRKKCFLQLKEFIFIGIYIGNLDANYLYKFNDFKLTKLFKILEKRCNKSPIRVKMRLLDPSASLSVKRSSMQIRTPQASSNGITRQNTY